MGAVICSVPECTRGSIALMSEVIREAGRSSGRSAGDRVGISVTNFIRGESASIAGRYTIELQRRRRWKDYGA
jgi:hypothetical protein